MPDYNWEAIQKRWESGESARSISASMGGKPSHTAINKRSKEWMRDISEVLMTLPETVVSELSDNQASVLRYISQGMTQKTAAELTGVHEVTVSNWNKVDAFAKAKRVAVGIKTANRLGRVERSLDTRDARWLLERDPDSRGDYGQDGGTTVGTQVNILGKVNLGIDRS